MRMNELINATSASTISADLALAARFNDELAAIEADTRKVMPEIVPSEEVNCRPTAQQ